MTKTSKPFTAALIALVALGAFGCAAIPAPTGASAPAQVATLLKRKLMSDEQEPAALRSWSLSFQKATYVEDYHWETITKYDDSGRIKRQRDVKVWETPYWRPVYSYDGDAGLTYLGNSGFAYRVPAGRFLRITRAKGSVGVGGTAVDGQRFGQTYATGESFDLLFGPGQLVTMGFNKETHLFGYTADVAMLGLGPTPAKRGEDDVSVVAK